MAPSLLYVVSALGALNIACCCVLIWSRIQQTRWSCIERTLDVVCASSGTMQKPCSLRNATNCAMLLLDKDISAVVLGSILYMSVVAEMLSVLVEACYRWTCKDDADLLHHCQQQQSIPLAKFPWSYRCTLGTLAFLIASIVPTIVLALDNGFAQTSSCPPRHAGGIRLRHITFALRLLHQFPLLVYGMLDASIVRRYTNQQRHIIVQERQCANIRVSRPLDATVAYDWEDIEALGLADAWPKWRPKVPVASVDAQLDKQQDTDPPVYEYTYGDDIWVIPIVAAGKP
ncbi:hypothetical protein THASP1DRAFT_24375 [Thamnocephalis sphaerospora]|uniref:Uncharacterized protein n=1 Tax=Thamnocephalis sphaerospora TaxID=78915 RepID=A0A4P9XNS2_9FUNG|nr:hypothetical protein THASP1DRAFT_24375 [Thamnocephalis sphaerospora]|eukprot:RKP07482.1 hypothetical protein THASP1DRAFT_24375 [Thamnocephalis sphaerospora]